MVRSGPKADMPINRTNRLVRNPSLHGLHLGCRPLAVERRLLRPVEPHHQIERVVRRRQLVRFLLRAGRVFLHVKRQ